MSDGTDATRGYPAYLRAREAVRRLKAAAGPAADGARPSSYWAEELEHIDYLAEATPLIVRKLRQHAFHVTGIRPYDYRDKGDSRREYFEARLAALRALGGDALMVAESPALGGFGYEIGDRLFNVDTLKFFEVLVGMERGDVLPALRRLDRPLVCEVGAGWGGFAYQFKTLVPRSTYVIIDFPELFLFSATYLGTLFPEARLLFWEPDAGLDGWRDADFVFVPSAAADAVSRLPLDLVVNMVSFQEMTEAQVRGYGRMAAMAGCPLFYSLNRERSPYNTELTSVSTALADCYRLSEVAVLATDYTSAMKKPPKPGSVTGRSELRYRHQVGRLVPQFARTAGVPGLAAAGGGPRVALAMTLFNNAGHLREALDSLRAQTATEYTLVLLDDASSDDTPAIAREYAARDPRVRYFRHETRQAMVATWREAVDLAIRECPSAEYVAWVSDHDRWHPLWLERLAAELDRDPGLVLAYPITRRTTPEGEEIEKGPRLFETAPLGDLQDRWRHFCRHGVGAGDMVYGLMRVDAFRRTGGFRTVLRPDRLLVAELTLFGRIRQVPEVLWFRRLSATGSVARQSHTLVLEGQAPSGFSAPPWFQHARALWRDYAVADPSPLPISRGTWRRMLLRYQVSYGWRHLRRSETSHLVGRGINSVIRAAKLIRHHYHHAVYHLLVGGRALGVRARRTAGRLPSHWQDLTQRLGIRGKRPETGAR